MKMLPLDLAPLVFQFLPVDTIESFPKDDPLLISVLKIQVGCRPFKVIYTHYYETTYFKVEHMESYILRAFSREVLSSLGVVHKVELKTELDTLVDLIGKNDKADDSHAFSQAEELEISCSYMRICKIDLNMFPRLRILKMDHVHKFCTISSILVNEIDLPGEYIRECNRSGDVFRDVIVEMNNDRSQMIMKILKHYVTWATCFDKSWFRSIELRQLSFSLRNVAILEGFSNLRVLKFEDYSIQLSQNWLPSLPLEKLIFWNCDILGTEFGSFPLLKELVLAGCRMEPFRSHFPQLESLIFLNWVDESLCSVPIAKKDLKNVKSFTLLMKKAGQFDLTPFEKLKNLTVLRSFDLQRLNGLNHKNLEHVTIERCPYLKVDFPCHVNVKVSNAVNRRRLRSIFGH